MGFGGKLPNSNHTESVSRMPEIMEVNLMAYNLNTKVFHADRRAGSVSPAGLSKAGREALWKDTIGRDGGEQVGHSS